MKDKNSKGSEKPYKETTSHMPKVLGQESPIYKVHTNSENKDVSRIKFRLKSKR